jgi:hypothetical protein
MKSINTDAWLVNFMLSSSGLSPILIGPKVIFFQINVTHKDATMCISVGLRPNQNEPTLIKFHLKQLQLCPTKSFWAIWTTPAYKNNFGLNPATNMPNSFYDAYDLSHLACHIRCHIRFYLAWQSYRNEVMTFCIDDFPCVIKLMTPTK